MSLQNQNIVVIDYGAGNLRSVTKAFERAANDSSISANISLSSNADEIAKADRIILPGVGAYADCAANLHALDGVVDALNDAVLNRAVPFFGICVGMQLMSARGLEKTTTTGLGWIKADVSEIQPADPSLKVPQMGWNTLNIERDHALFNGIETGADGLHAYFVHSYHMADVPADNLLASTNYGGQVTAAVQRDNMIGTQFHPEKSQALGLALISNFLKWAP